MYSYLINKTECSDKCVCGEVEGGMWLWFIIMQKSTVCMILTKFSRNIIFIPWKIIGLAMLVHFTLEHVHIFVVRCH